MSLERGTSGGALRVLVKPGMVGIEIGIPGSIVTPVAGHAHQLKSGTARLDSTEDVVKLIGMLVDAGREAFGVEPMHEELICRLNSPLKTIIQ